MIIHQICSSMFKRGILFVFLCMSVLQLFSQSLIIKQPENITKCFSETYAILSLEATGTGQDGYIFQWQKWDGSNYTNILTGGNGPVYTVQFDKTLKEFPAILKFQCIVRNTRSNPVETETSDEVVLTINHVPGISNIKVQKEACNGDEVTASAGIIETNGYNLEEYKWTIGNMVKDGNIDNKPIPDITFTLNNSRSDWELKLKITNSCGSDSVSQNIHVWPTPDPPTSLINESYCQKDSLLNIKIVETDPVWFSNPPTSPINEPVLDMSKSGTYSWWVLRQVKYTEVTCKSEIKNISVKIVELPEPPKASKDTVLCLNEREFVLQATGTEIVNEIKWYHETTENNKLVIKRIPAAPTINPSIAGQSIYYVTQTASCESRLNDGKITVDIIRRAETEKISLPDTINLCPNSSRVIIASSDVQNPVFRWYGKLNKTEFLQEGPTRKTSILSNDTTYYVTLTYGGLCESSYPKSVSIRVRDIELPNLEPPPNLEVETDPGECFASKVDIGRPIVSDNCTPEERLIVFTDPNDFSYFPDFFVAGDTTLMWWVVDEARNTTRGLQSISVRDREKPKGTCPSNIPVYINDNETSAIVYYELKYTDNCGYVKDSLNLGLPSGSEFPKGETLVRHLMMDKAGNTETCEFKVIVGPPYRKMEVDLRISKNQLCPGEQVVITPIINGGSGRYNYTWKSPRFWTEAEIRDYPLDDTTYEITVSDDSTSVTKTAQITVLNTQQVEFLPLDRPMDQIFEGDEILVTAMSGFASYKLLLNNEVIQTSGLNSGVSFQAELGTYFVRVFATDFNDCVTQDEMKILVDSRKLPNVFTPNFDGKNDIFLEGFDLKVFSRAGQLLYEGFDGWDGTFKGKMMPEGTYMYVVRRIMNNGEPRVFKDYVTLKR